MPSDPEAEPEEMVIEFPYRHRSPETHAGRHRHETGSGRLPDQQTRHSGSILEEDYPFDDMEHLKDRFSRGSSQRRNSAERSRGLSHEQKSGPTSPRLRNHLNHTVVHSNCITSPPRISITGRTPLRSSANAALPKAFSEAITTPTQRYWNLVKEVQGVEEVEERTQTYSSNRLRSYIDSARYRHAVMLQTFPDLETHSTCHNALERLDLLCSRKLEQETAVAADRFE